MFQFLITFCTSDRLKASMGSVLSSCHQVLDCLLQTLSLGIKQTISLSPYAFWLTLGKLFDLAMSWSFLNFIGFYAVLSHLFKLMTCYLKDSSHRSFSIIYKLLPASFCIVWFGAILI